MKKYLVWIMTGIYFFILQWIVILTLVWFLIITILEADSVYYAKYVPHDKNRYPEVEMIIDNLPLINTPELNEIRYGKSRPYYIRNDIKDITLSADGNGYYYKDASGYSYYFNQDYKLFEVLNNNSKRISLKSVDEEKIKKEIYGFVKPIIEAQTDPIFKWQRLFNWYFGDKFKN